MDVIIYRYIYIHMYNYVYRCGYATLHDVISKTKEDRMESFFLSETCKYLYLVSEHTVGIYVRIGTRYTLTD